MHLPGTLRIALELVDSTAHWYPLFSFDFERQMAGLLDTLLRRDPDTLSAQIGSEGAMLNPNSGRYHGLNDIGMRIWTLLETPQTPAQLRDQLLDEFDVNEQECQEAVLDFVGKLLDRGVIRAEP